MRPVQSLCAIVLVFSLFSCAGTKVKPDAQSAFQQGMVLFDRGKYAEALPHFEKALELDPEFSKAHLYLGRSRLNQGQWLEAIPPLRAAYRLAPEESKKETMSILLDAILGAAVSELKKGDFSQSVGLFKEALKLEPGSGEVKGQLAGALVNWGGDLLSKGDWSGAATAYGEAADIAPDNLQAFMGLAQAFFKGGDLKKALESAQKALKIDPSYFEALSLLLKIGLGAGK